MRTEVNCLPMPSTTPSPVQALFTSGEMKTFWPTSSLLICCSLLDLASNRRQDLLALASLLGYLILCDAFNIVAVNAGAFPIAHEHAKDCASSRGRIASETAVCFETTVAFLPRRAERRLTNHHGL